MSDKKVIAVVGATGAQGGGLVHAILNDQSGAFSARALTRNPDSDKARALSEAGAEVVQADLNDVESLKKAFQGAYGAFGITNFWEHFSPEKEMEQAKNLAEAAKAADIKHFVWSTLEDTRNWVPLEDDRMPTLMDNYKVPHFDAKGASNKFFSELGVPTTNLLTAFYWENLITFGMGPRRGEDGNLIFALAISDKKLPSIAVGDIGKCTFGIFKAGDTYINKTVGIAGEHLTGEEMAASLSKAYGEKVHYYAVPFDVARAFDAPGAEDLGNMMQFKCDFNEYFCNSRDLELSEKLNPELQSFEEWLGKNVDRIPIQ